LGTESFHTIIRFSFASAEPFPRPKLAVHLMPIPVTSGPVTHQCPRPVITLGGKI
jgi:hypothetical protein